MKDNFFGNVDDELKRVLQFFPNGGMNLENIVLKMNIKKNFLFCYGCMVV